MKKELGHVQYLSKFHDQELFYVGSAFIVTFATIIRVRLVTDVILFEETYAMP
jgi:hypothetical protein